MGCPEKLWMPLPECVQGQIGWGPEQIELVGATLPTVGHWGSIHLKDPSKSSHSVILWKGCSDKAKLTSSLCRYRQNQLYHCASIRLSRVLSEWLPCDWAASSVFKMKINTSQQQGSSLNILLHEPASLFWKKVSGCSAKWAIQLA